jgi:uncharacterized membrane protein YjfL (UPF0719 family)
VSRGDTNDKALDQLAAQPAPKPPPLPAALEAELRSLAPVRPRRPLRQLAIVLGASLVYGAGLLAALTMRRDLDELPIAWVVGTAIAWLVGFAVPCYFALAPGRGSVMPRWRWAGASAIVTSIAFVVFGLLVHPSGPSSIDHGWHDFAQGHLCLELGLAVAIVPVILGTLFLRGVMPVRSRPVAAALGAGGGSLGGFVLHLACPVADGLHIGLIHGGVVIVAALLSAALVPRATDRPLT